MRQNTKLEMGNSDFHVRIPVYVVNNFVCTPTIPFLYPGGYDIVMNRMQIFGNSDEALFPWQIIKDVAGITLFIENQDAAYYFGTLHPGSIWDIYFSVIEL